jgi:ABC-type nitrate/sulfonate/bicarbonate transport system ATPase subunit
MVAVLATPSPSALEQPSGGSLRVYSVSKEFISPDGRKVHALKDVSLAVQPGEFVSLLGPSGCGKSTLLRLVAGLDMPTSGQLLLDGKPIEGPSAERGLVFQDTTLYPWLTVRRNIESALRIAGVLKQRAGQVDEYIRLVGLEGFDRAYPQHLSGGMAHRVALARALINHPKVLLLDEPLGGLDAFNRMRMQDEVLRLWELRRGAMLLVTHDIDEAIYMSDRIIIMSDRPGTVEAILTVEMHRPRQRNNPYFTHLRNVILEMLHFARKESVEYFL